MHLSHDKLHLFFPFRDKSIGIHMVVIRCPLFRSLQCVNDKVNLFVSLNIEDFGLKICSVQSYFFCCPTNVGHLFDHLLWSILQGGYNRTYSSANFGGWSLNGLFTHLPCTYLVQRVNMNH